MEETPDHAHELHRQHHEVFRDRETNRELARLYCSCPIGTTHDYIDWLALPAHRTRLDRALEVWDSPAPESVDRIRKRFRRSRS